MFPEHSQIVLTAAISGDFGEALVPGDVGTIIHIQQGGVAFVVEFFTLDGDTAAIATVLPHQARPITGSEIAQAREWVAVS